MAIKKKLMGALAISTATLMFSFPAFAGTTVDYKQDKKAEEAKSKQEEDSIWFSEKEFKNKLGQENYVGSLTKEYVAFCQKFEKEFEKRLEVELKKREGYIMIS